MNKETDLHEPQTWHVTDEDGFTLVNRRGTKTSMASGSSATKPSASRKQVQLGVRNNANIKTVPKTAWPTPV
ncbi:hypothetical protein PR048_013583 [Dryococelus australis]|uniref:Uncharacterized protein n=1 Tax=Dryococelus australis TaxID=614101 RepID=A0ABQ9HSL8_9NEOP|nr:hypothetical protein PR048_013583 [Dryococelus australis]